MSATELVCAAPSQQRLRRSRSSVAAALQPSTQMVFSSLRPTSRCCWQHLEEGRSSGTSRRDASCAQHQLRRSSISSVAAASAPSQQHQLRRSSISSVAAAAAGDGSVSVYCLATMGHDERSTGAFLEILSAARRTDKLYVSRLFWGRYLPYRVQHPQFWGTLQGTASTTPPINGNAKGVVSV